MELRPDYRKPCSCCGARRVRFKLRVQAWSFRQWSWHTIYRYCWACSAALNGQMWLFSVQERAS